MFIFVEICVDTQKLTKKTLLEKIKLPRERAKDRMLKSFNGTVTGKHVGRLP